MSFYINSTKVIDNDIGVLFSHQSVIPPANITLTETKITASDGTSGDYFGSYSAVGNSRIVVGAPYDNVDGLAASGSAYIFDLSGNQIAKISAVIGTSTDTNDSDYFGNSVACGNGRIVVGSDNDDDNGTDSGSAYIFDINGNYIAKIKPSDGSAYDKFGWRVAVGCGRIVVSSHNDDDKGSGSGSAYIFDLDGNQLVKLTASDGVAGDTFGRSVAIDCGRIVVGANLDDGKGSAYIFDLYGNQLSKITASDGATSDFFGWSVAIGSGRIAVGSHLSDNGGTNRGSAYIFDLNGTQLAKLTASDAADSHYFGYSVAIGSGKIIVSADNDDTTYTNSGSIYVFDLAGNELVKIVASDRAASDFFGSSIAIGSGKLIACAFGDDDNGSLSGSGYIYNLGDSHENTFEEMLSGFVKE